MSLLSAWGCKVIKERTINEEIEELEEEIANKQRRLDQLRALKSEREDFMTPANRHPGFRQWRARRERER